MGFKWFKARMRMNRMPSQSSAVAGTYRIRTFDTSNNDHKSNENGEDYKDTDVTEPQLGVRQMSMPNLNNPMDEISNENDIEEFVRLSNNNKGNSLSTTNLEGPEFAATMYKGLGAGEPIPLTSQSIKKDSNENIEIRTPRPAQKTKIGDYKKKKVKASSAPRIIPNLSSANTSKNGKEEFITLENRRRVSQDSDIDV